MVKPFPSSRVNYSCYLSNGVLIKLQLPGLDLDLRSKQAVLTPK